MKNTLPNEINTELIQELMDFANQLAASCESIITTAFSKKTDFIMKEDNSPVTEIDQEVERVMRELITARYPEHGILGEEYDNIGLDRDLIWVLDPIDGTKQFASGHYGFGTLIALTYKRQPILGIINQPVTGERWVGASGMPTTLNGQTVTTRECEALEQAVLALSSPGYFTGDDVRPYQELEKSSCWSVYGGGCLAYGVLANGRVDMCLDASFEPFDYMALVPIIEGAGGVITDWNGDALTLDSDGKLLATGSMALHQKALALLKQG